MYSSSCGKGLRREEFETGTYIPSLRKQIPNIHCCLGSFSIQSKIPARERCHPQCAGLPTETETTTRTLHRHAHIHLPLTFRTNQYTFLIHFLVTSNLCKNNYAWNPYCYNMPYISLSRPNSSLSLIYMLTCVSTPVCIYMHTQSLVLCKPLWDVWHYCKCVTYINSFNEHQSSVGAFRSSVKKIKQRHSRISSKPRCCGARL